MPGSPNGKVIVTTSGDRQAAALTNANMKTMMSTQDGLEALQKLITRNTTPPAECSYTAITAWVAALP